MANVVSVDFSNVKESSGINPVHQEEGDYVARIVKADLGKSKKNDPMVTFVFQDTNRRSATYPYYCVLQDNQLWKLRNVLIAAGVSVPKSKGKINLDKVLNREVGITLEDDEYEGKLKSVIAAVMPKDDVEGEIVPAEDDDIEDADELEDEEVEEEEPAPVKKRKAAPAPEPEDDDEDEAEDEEEEVEEAPAPKARAKRKPAPAPVEEDEDEDDDLDLD